MDMGVTARATAAGRCESAKAREMRIGGARARLLAGGWAGKEEAI